MEREEINKTLYYIFSDIFNTNIESLFFEMNPDNIEGWDSLAHVKLIMAIEEKFKLYISPEDQLEMLTFELIGDIIEEQY